MLVLSEVLLVLFACSRFDTGFNGGPELKQPPAAQNSNGS